MQNSSIVMRLPQEILCEVFSHLGNHPVHFTRVTQVCRTWNFAADNHLFWRQLVKYLKLSDPKPKARKYKIYKSIIFKNWGKFCTLCNVRRTQGSGFNIRRARIDMTRVDKINWKTSTWM